MITQRHASSKLIVFWTLGSATTPSRMFPEYYNDKPSSLCRYRPVRTRTPKHTGKICLPKSDIEFWMFRRFSKDVRKQKRSTSKMYKFGCSSQRTSKIWMQTNIQNIQNLDVVRASSDLDVTSKIWMLVSTSKLYIQNLDVCYVQILDVDYVQSWMLKEASSKYR